MRYLTITIPTSRWQRIDACADNTVSVDIEDGDIGALVAGACVRDAGWRAADRYVGKRELGWPPSDYPLEVTLRTEHWRWVLAQLARWAHGFEHGDLIESIEAALHE